MRIGKILWISIVIAFSTLSTMAQTGPGGVGNIDGTSDLKGWWKIDNGITINNSNQVTNWNNSVSIPELNMTANSGSYPVYNSNEGGNGKGEISFDGAQYLTSSSKMDASYFPTSETTIFLLNQSDNSSQNSSAYATHPANSSRFSAHTPWSGTAYFDLGQCCGSNARITTPYPSSDVGNYFIWNFNMSTTSGKSIYRNEDLRSSRAGSSTFYNHSSYDLTIGGRNGYFKGDMTEFILFTKPVNGAQRVIISNYLSAKYDLTLTYNDYYAYDSSSEGNFDFDVSGIGQDSNGNNHTDSQGASMVRINSPSNLNNSEYLFWGHNNGNLLFNTCDVQGTTYERLNRTWRADKTGDVGTVSVSFDLSEYTSINADNLILLLDSNTDADQEFGTGSITEHSSGRSYDAATKTLTFTNVNFTDGAYFTLGSQSVNSISSVQYTCGFSYKKVLEIDASKVSSINGTDLTNFPMLVHFNSDADLSSATGHVKNSTGYDIVFVDSNGDHLNHDIEYYDPSTGTYRAWVNLPILSASANSKIYMLYGKENQDSDPSTDCVWNNSYISRYHLDEDPSGTTTDHTGNGNNGSLNAGGMNSSDVVTGKIGGALEFDGNDRIDLGDNNKVGNNYTINLWMQANVSSTYWAGVLGNNNGGSWYRAPGIWVRNYTQIHGGFGDGGNWNAFTSGYNTIQNASSSWDMLTFQYDGTDFTIYSNGILQYTYNRPGVTSLDASVRFLGGIDNYYKGKIDEISLSNVNRSADWINTEYNNQNDPNSFYSTSLERITSITLSVIDNSWNTPSAWASGDVPGVGDDAYVDGYLDLDNEDHCICNLYVINQTSQNARMRLINSKTLKVKENVELRSINANYSTRLLISSSAHLEVDGDFILTRDSDNTQQSRTQLELTGAGSTLDIHGNLTADFKASSTTESNEEFNIQDALVTIDGQVSITSSMSAPVDFYITGGSFTVGKDFNFSSSGTSSTSLLINGDGNLDVSGDLTYNQTGGTTALLAINTVNGSTAAMNIAGDVNLIHSGGDNFTLQLGGASSSLAISGDLDLDNIENADLLKVQLDGTSSLLNIDGNIDLNDVSSGGKVELEFNSSSKLELAGIFIQNSNYGSLDFNETSILEFNGNIAQTFPGDMGSGGDEMDYQNIVINNSFGTSPQLTMGGLATIHGQLSLLQGIISSDQTNILVLDENSDAINESDNSYIDGYIRKMGTNDFEFPIGDNNQLRPISISNVLGSSTDAFEAAYFMTDPSTTYDDDMMEEGMHHISSCEYWMLNQSIGSPHAVVKMNWDDNSCGVSSMTEMLVARWDGTQWSNHGNGGMSGNTTIGTIMSGSGGSTPERITNFSPFTLGSSGSVNPLPIELVSFDAIANGEKVDIYWSTATETNNDFFTIERSSDGENFIPILTASGAGNSSVQIDYMDIDYHPHNGISYYRLKQTDFDGAFSYSQIKVVKFYQNEAERLALFPNPSNGDFNVSLTGFAIETDVLVVVRDMAGRELYSKIAIIAQTSKEVVAIDLENRLPEGVYTVTGSSSNEVFSKKLIVKSSNQP